MKVISCASTDNGDEHSYLFEMSGAALYKSSIASLPTAPEAKTHERSSTTNSSVSRMDVDDVEKLEERASTLRKELANKNKYLKVVMDQLRELTNDVSTWKSPCSEPNHSYTSTAAKDPGRRRRSSPATRSYHLALEGGALHPWVSVPLDSPSSANSSKSPFIQTYKNPSNQPFP
ncbi:hypothetical protein AgCh_030829 [Apium graveolens]